MKLTPMKWLESLAARQGANPEEFTTSADMSVDEVDPETADMSQCWPRLHALFST